jgi:hypothetical protein
LQATYCFEVHRGEFEKSSEKWRQAHAASSLCHDDVNIDFAGARSDGSVDGSGVKQEIETFLAARSKDEKWLLVDVFRGFQRRASSERF